MGGTLTGDSCSKIAKTVPWLSGLWCLWGVRGGDLGGIEGGWVVDSSGICK